MIDPNFMVRKQVDGYPFFEVLTPGSTQVVFSSKDSRVCLLKSGNVSTTRQARFQEMIKGEEGNVWECVRLADESKEGAEGWYSILGGDEEGGDQDYEEGSEGWTTNKGGERRMDYEQGEGRRSAVLFNARFGCPYANNILLIGSILTFARSSHRTYLLLPPPRPTPRTTGGRGEGGGHRSSIKHPPTHHRHPRPTHPS